MCYSTDGSKLELNSRDAFLSVMGAKTDEPEDSFKVKRSELPEDNSKLVMLNVSV